MEHDEQMVLVSSAGVEVNNVHYTVSFLQQIQSSFVLFPLDELIGRVIEFGHNDWYLVLADSELLVIMLIEDVVFIVEGGLGAQLVSLVLNGPFG
jgi:hypothetical protein